MASDYEKRMAEKRNARAEDPESFVVIHDYVNVRHPEDISEKPQDASIMLLARGDKLPDGFFQAELDRLLAMDPPGVAEADSQEGKLALAKIPRGGAPVGAIPLLQGGEEPAAEEPAEEPKRSSRSSK